MSDEKAERPVIKCQGQVVNVRLPRPNENPKEGRISTIALSTPGVPQIGYLYLRQLQGYRLGFAFAVEVTLHRIPDDKFYDKRDLKPRPETGGVEPV